MSDYSHPARRTIPFFLSPTACPYHCAYCNQAASGQAGAHTPSPAFIARSIEEALDRAGTSSGLHWEAGFFGGTFTLLPLDVQTRLLGAVQPFLKDGRIQGLRLSTRPDALTDDQVLFLKHQGVTTIELGAPSFDDEVLVRCRRGHGAADTRKAAARVRNHGLALGLQLLPGLPGETAASRSWTLNQALALEPAEARIYPLVILDGTPMADEYRAGRFEPLSLDRAVRITARFFRSFTLAGIRVIRMGLQDTEELRRRLVAGPHHPAFGEEVKASVLQAGLIGIIGNQPPPERAPSAPMLVHLAPVHQSQVLGPGRSRLARLREATGRPGLEIRFDPELEPWTASAAGRVYSILEKACLGES